MVAVTSRDYWLHPTKGNRPKDYLRPGLRTDFLLSLFHRFIPRETSVLEVGCNVGRNLQALLKARYAPAGVELNPRAVELGRRLHPGIPVRVGPAEDILPLLPSRSFDTVFTMAVLEHLPRTSESVFSDMARIARRFVLTIEDETHEGPRHFRRHYGMIFRALGLREVHTHLCDESLGLDESFVARVFERV